MYGTSGGDEIFLAPEGDSVPRIKYLVTRGPRRPSYVIYSEVQNLNHIT